MTPKGRGGESFWRRQRRLLEESNAMPDNAFYAHESLATDDRDGPLTFVLLLVIGDTVKGYMMNARDDVPAIMKQVKHKYGRPPLSAAGDSLDPLKALTKAADLLLQQVSVHSRVRLRSAGVMELSESVPKELLPAIDRILREKFGHAKN